MSETFCWFPPERDWTGCSIDAADLEPSHEVDNLFSLAPAAEQSDLGISAQDLNRRVRSYAQDGEEGLPDPIAAQEPTPLEERRAETGRRARCRCTASFRSSALPRRGPAETEPGHCLRRPRSRGSRPCGPRDRSDRTDRPRGRKSERSRSARVRVAVGERKLKRRPIISVTSAFSDIPAASNVPWATPSRRTVIRSAIPSTSGGGG